MKYIAYTTFSELTIDSLRFRDQKVSEVPNILFRTCHAFTVRFGDLVVIIRGERTLLLSQEIEKLSVRLYTLENHVLAR